MLPDYVFEISFEIGNKVGGIHTVLTTKSKQMKEIFGNNYFGIGFFNPRTFYLEIEEVEMPDFLKRISEELKREGIKIRFGKWILANNIQAIIIDAKEFEKKEDEYVCKDGSILRDKKANLIKRWLWDFFRIDSLRAGYDFTEPVVWSYATGLLLEKLITMPKFKNKNIVAHFHEWLSGTGLLYLKWKKLPVVKIFTTHATRIGRAKSERGENVLKEVEKGNKSSKTFDENLSYNYGIEAQHKLEKECVKNCDVFTTVSEIVSKEAKYFLGKYADIVTPNGLDLEALSFGPNWIIEREKLREKIKDFLEAYFSPYYQIETSNPLIFFTSGRYEFYNKGIDLFIDALGLLDKMLRKENFEKPIFIFLSIIFPNTFAKPEVIENKVAYDEFQENAQLAFDVHFSNFVREGLLGPKKFSLDESLRNELKERIIAYNYLRKMREGKNPPLCALVLPYDEKDDLIINALEKNSLINSEKNVVKVIYYPSFLTSADFLLGMNYSEFVSTATLGVFPSRYEPWGYTPFETAALRVLSITTNASGFGNFILSMGYGNDFPIYVLDILNKKRDEVVKELANLMKRVAYMDEEERLILSLKGRKILESLDWKRVIEHYLKAYSLGIKKLINI